MIDEKQKFMLINNDALSALKEIPDNTFHTVVTSPPYWQLRDYFVSEQLGQESTPEEYIKRLVEIMGEVKRVLRKDGTCWFNIGDGYNNSSGFERTSDWKREGRKGGSSDKKAFKHSSIKTKDLIGMPWRLAFAFQEAGWYLRCDVVWGKSNPMPDGAKDRPTRGHEYIFLLTKSSKYFYDYYAVLENTDEHPDKEQGFGANVQEGTFRQDQERSFQHYGKRNMRSVWKTSVASFKGKHYATFPLKLIDPCIKAGTSEYGCCVNCGTPWVRKFEKIEKEIEKEGTKKHTESGSNLFPEIKVKKEYKLYLVERGWQKQCTCETDEVKSCIVLDPFSGMATTGLASIRYKQNYVGIELNKEYQAHSRQRLSENSDIFLEEVNELEKL
jgi:DNA modification methylase